MLVGRHGPPPVEGLYLWAEKSCDVREVAMRVVMAMKLHVGQRGGNEVVPLLTMGLLRLVGSLKL